MRSSTPPLRALATGLAVALALGCGGGQGAGRDGGATGGEGGAGGAPGTGRRVILILVDGFRADMLSPTDTPRMFELAGRGVRFQRHHSVFPCTTMTNAGAIATGSYPQKSSWWGEKLYVPSASGTDARGERVDFSQHVDVRDWGTLKRLDDAYNGRLATAQTLFKAAKAAGLRTAILGKPGATFLQDMEFPTYFIDTDTAAPLAFARELQARGYALPPFTPKAFPEIALPQAYVNPYTPVTPPLMEDGLTSNPKSPQARPSQTAAYAYFVEQFVDFILPRKAPDLSFLWLNEPDATMHTYGPGSAQYRAALREVDGWIGQIVAKVDELPELRGKTDIIVTADHGATTVSGHLEAFPLRAIDEGRDPEGRVVGKPGAVDHDDGYAVSGQTMLVELLRREGFKAFNGRRCVYDPLMTGVRADGSRVYQESQDAACGGRKYTSAGYPVPAELPDEAVLLMETAGGDFIYVPGHDKAVVERVVRFLQERPEIGSIFVHGQYGEIPGTLPMGALMLENAARSRTPDIAFDFWTDERARVQGVAGIGYHNKPSPAGMRGDHGALAPQDVSIVGFAVGPSFRERFVDPVPTANVDLAPTIAHLLGLDRRFIEAADGRVLLEALRNGRPESDYQVSASVIRPAAPATGLDIRKPGSVDGRDLDPGRRTYTFELHVSTVKADDRSYRYVERAQAARQ